MNKIKNVLKAIDERLNKQQPKTMDDLITCVHSTEGAGAYGTHFHIVEYMGYLQGLRVCVTGRSKTHILPGKGKVYSVFQGVQKYKEAGYPVIND
jgi:hypothetical protein